MIVPPSSTARFCPARRSAIRARTARSLQMRLTLLRPSGILHATQLQVTMSSKSDSTPRAGVHDDRATRFTLVELLVVIAIIGVLIALLVAGGPIRSRSRSPHRMHQQPEANRPGTAKLSRFQAQFSRRIYFPTRRRHGIADPGTGDAGPGWTCFFQIMPFLEESHRAAGIRPDAALPGTPRTPTAAATPLSIYRCPTVSDGSLTYTVKDANGSAMAEFSRSHYVACSGRPDVWEDPDGTQIPKLADGVFFRNSHIRIREITDGTQPHHVRLGTNARAQRFHVGRHRARLGHLPDAALCRGRLRRRRAAGALSQRSGTRRSAAGDQAAQRRISRLRRRTAFRTSRRLQRADGRWQRPLGVGHHQPTALGRHGHARRRRNRGTSPMTLRKPCRWHSPATLLACVAACRLRRPAANLQRKYPPRRKTANRYRRQTIDWLELAAKQIDQTASRRQTHRRRIRSRSNRSSPMLGKAIGPKPASS